MATPARLWYQSGVQKGGEATDEEPYKIVSGASTPNSRELADWLAKDGQLLIPLVELLEKGERAIDEVVDVMGRATIEAVLQELAERDLSELDVLGIYLDGIVFGDYHVLAAVGADADGRQHVLGLCGGASEDTEVTAGLLEDLMARGLRADRRRLFVIVRA